MMRQGERGKTGDHGQRGERGERGETGQSRLSLAQRLVYLLILVVVGIGFFKFEQADRASQVQRDQICETQIDNREALRQVYRDVATLGLSLLDNPDTTPERREVLRQRFEVFERDRLGQFPELEPGCKQPSTRDVG